MANTALHGKRYINLLKFVRQQDKDAPTDKEINDRFAAEHGMVHVGDEVIGRPVTQSDDRRALERLISDRRQLKHFDVLLVSTMSRFSRCGPDHAMHLRQQFARAGVAIVATDQRLPDTSFEEMLRPAGDPSHDEGWNALLRRMVETSLHTFDPTGGGKEAVAYVRSLSIEGAERQLDAIRKFEATSQVSVIEVIRDVGRHAAMPRETVCDLFHLKRSRPSLSFVVVEEESVLADDEHPDESNCASVMRSVLSYAGLAVISSR